MEFSHFQYQSTRSKSTPTTSTKITTTTSTTLTTTTRAPGRLSKRCEEEQTAFDERNSSTNVYDPLRNSGQNPYYARPIPDSCIKDIKKRRKIVKRCFTSRSYKKFMARPIKERSNEKQKLDHLNYNEKEATLWRLWLTQIENIERGMDVKKCSSTLRGNVRDI